MKPRTQKLLLFSFFALILMLYIFSSSQHSNAIHLVVRPKNQPRTAVTFGASNLLQQGSHGSSFGAMEVIGARNALLWDKVLIGETLIKALSVQNFSSEAFEVNCEMINYSLQLGISPCAVTYNWSFKESEMENIYELIIDDPYNLIGQHCTMFLWRISASVKPDLKLLFRVAKNFKTTGNLLYNAFYEVLGITLITASSFNKARKIIMVMSNAVHEPYKTTYVQLLIEVCKTLQLVEDEITKLIRWVIQ